MNERWLRVPSIASPFHCDTAREHRPAEERDNENNNNN